MENLVGDLVGVQMVCFLGDPEMDHVKALVEDLELDHVEVLVEDREMNQVKVHQM